ncbi:auxin-responsive protein SAUR32-like [Capsicum galapagoense]
MGSGDKHHHHHHHLKFHVQLHLPSFHHHHGHENSIEELRDIPKGCVAVMVGQGEEQQRFVIPVMHINHPLFVQLLKGAEDEVEFRHDGPIIVPCHVEEFRHVEGIIQHDNNHHLWCFKA